MTMMLPPLLVKLKDEYGQPLLVDMNRVILVERDPEMPLWSRLHLSNGERVRCWYSVQDVYKAWNDARRQAGLL